VGQVYVAPRTPVEEVLASIFCDVLGLDQVGIHDSFFDLGGHSLLAARIINRTREILMVEVPLVSLFEAPTVAELSGKILALEPQAESIARTLMRIRHMSAGERQRLLDHKKA
jgi:acyl carrier protein